MPKFKDTLSVPSSTAFLAYLYNFCFSNPTYLLAGLSVNSSEQLCRLVLLRYAGTAVPDTSTRHNPTKGLSDDPSSIPPRAKQRALTVSRAERRSRLLSLNRLTESWKGEQIVDLRTRPLPESVWFQPQYTNNCYFSLGS